MGALQPRGRHSPPLALPPDQSAWLAKVDSFLELPPIPGPKPWTDDVEKAAVFKVLNSAPPTMALCGAGVSLSQAQAWLSENPPPTYESACHALSGRLKSAEQASASELFARIHAASQDPKIWTAAAWVLERKHGFIQGVQAESGPKTVINIGQLNVSQGDAPRRIEDVIEAEVIPAKALQSSSPT